MRRVLCGIVLPHSLRAYFRFSAQSLTERSLLVSVSAVSMIVCGGQCEREDVRSSLACTESSIRLALVSLSLTGRARAARALAHRLATFFDLPYFFTVRARLSSQVV